MCCERIYGIVGEWPFDRRRRARLAQELADAHERAEAALKSGDETEMSASVNALRDAALTTPNSIAFEMGSYRLLRVLQESLESRRAERERKKAESVLERLEPCLACGSAEQYLSVPVAIDELVSSRRATSSPRMRIAVCATCGHASFWAVDFEELKAPPFDGTTVRAKDTAGGPFRR